MPTNRSFVPAANGNAFLTGQGFFEPSSGTFIPTRNGNFVLNVQASLDPKTGTFTPSATGNFLFSTRGDLIASGTGTPVATFAPFNPVVPLASSATIPLTTSLATNPYAFSPAYASAAMNPYSMAPVSEYMSSPYQAPYAMPYPATSAGTAPSASSSGAGFSAAVSNANGGDKGATGMSPATTYGIPFEKGHIKWPLAFRLLPPEMKENVADRLEGELLALAGQAGGGTVSAGLLADATRNVARLGAWLKEHQTDMAEATYGDGRAFVRMLDETLATMRY